MAHPLLLCHGRRSFDGGTGIVNAVNIYFSNQLRTSYAPLHLGLLLASITFPPNSHLRNTLH